MRGNRREWVLLLLLCAAIAALLTVIGRKQTRIAQLQAVIRRQRETAHHTIDRMQQGDKRTHGSTGIKQ